MSDQINLEDLSPQQQWHLMLQVAETKSPIDGMDAWKQYAKELEKTIERANATIEERTQQVVDLSHANAGNLAEKIVLRNALVRHAGVHSPLVADMLPMATKEDRDRAEFMRNEIKARASKALEQTNSFEAVRQAAENIPIE